MNKIQKQLILVELIVISLLLWRYFNDQLTYENAILYVSIYVICMGGWFYFRNKSI